MAKEKTITKEKAHEALKTLNIYYRQITGKKECIGFYVDYVQPIKILFEKIENGELTER